MPLTWTVCPICETRFKSTRADATTCSDPCRQTYYRRRKAVAAKRDRILVLLQDIADLESLAGSDACRDAIADVRQYADGLLSKR